MRVTNVGDLLASVALLDDVNKSWEVIYTSVAPVDVPELLVVNGERVVIPAITSASVIGKPDIETSSSELECHRLIGLVAQGLGPNDGVATHTVLHDD